MKILTEDSSYELSHFRGGLPPPPVVLGALLISLGAALVVNGLSMSLPEIYCDKRSLIIFCLVLVIGLSRGVFPDFYNHLPLIARMFTGSEIVTGAVFIMVTSIISLIVDAISKPDKVS